MSVGARPQPSRRQSQSHPARRIVVELLVVIYLAGIVGLPLVLAVYPVFAAPAGWQRIALLGLAPVVYGLTYPLIAGALARLTLGAIVAGRFPRDLGHRVYGPRRLYALCWTAVYYCGPIYHAVLAIPLLKRATLRLFGYRGSLRFTTYPDTWLRDLPLLDVNEGAYLSNKATIGTNMCLRDGTIVVDRVRIGRGVMIGHLAMLAPGSSMDDRAELGVGAALGIGVHVGEDSKIGPTCVVDHGAVVGRGCTIGTGSYVGKKAVIEDGVTIPAGFAVPERAVVRSQADVDDLRVVHRHTAELMAMVIKPPSGILAADQLADSLQGSIEIA
jgi:carbonic anhydrase/acetyltransferase-like protein (isoleucine patch superfamily)